MLYTGWGPIVLVVFLLITFGTLSFLGNLAGDGRYHHNHPFVALLIFAIAGVAVWFLGRFMNRKPVEVMEMDQHGRKLVPKARHTMWFIPAEYWGPILFALLTLILLKGLLL